jgi:ferritin
MQLSPQLFDMLNRQYNAEAFNARAYEALANKLEAMYLSGLASHMMSQAQGEREHTEKVRIYILDRNFTPSVTALDSFPIPPDVLIAFKSAATLEENTSTNWQNIHDAAVDDGDTSTIDLALQFMREQVEEERNAAEYLGRITFAAGNPAAILALDIAEKK